MVPPYFEVSFWRMQTLSSASFREGTLKVDENANSEIRFNYCQFRCKNNAVESRIIGSDKNTAAPAE